MRPEVKLFVPEGKIGTELISGMVVPVDELPWIATEVIQQEVQHVMDRLKEEGMVGHEDEVELVELPSLKRVRVKVKEKLFEITTEETEPHLTYLNYQDYVS